MKTKLTADQIRKIAEYIHQNKDTAEGQQACLRAALEHAGCTGKIKVNSTSATRYHRIAEEMFGPKKTKAKTAKGRSRGKAPPEPIAVCRCHFCGATFWGIRGAV